MLQSAEQDWKERRAFSFKKGSWRLEIDPHRYVLCVRIRINGTYDGREWWRPEGERGSFVSVCLVASSRVAFAHTVHRCGRRSFMMQMGWGLRGLFVTTDPQKKNRHKFAPVAVGFHRL